MTTKPFPCFDRTSDVVCIAARGAPEPIVDKFFAAGAVFGAIGVIVLGLRVWLVRSGVIALTSSYEALRSAHIDVAVYLFFGMFITGFLFQAGPKMLAVPWVPRKSLLTLIPLAATGVLCRAVAAFHLFGTVLLSLTYLVPAAAVFALFRATDTSRRVLLGPWMCCSVVTFVIAPWIDCSSPGRGLLLVLLSSATASFAAGRQFLVGFLGGNRVTPVQNGVQLLLFAAAILCAATAGDEDLLRWRFAGGLLLGSLAVAGGATGLWRVRFKEEPLSVAFFFGYYWAVTAALLVLKDGAAAADRSNHLLTTGWITPLVVAISAQMLRSFKGSFALHPKLLARLLLLWQIVPLCRGLLPPGTAPVVLGPVASAAAILLLGGWLYGVLAGMQPRFSPGGPKPAARSPSLV